MIMTVDIGGTKTMCTLWDHGRPEKRQKYTTSSIDDFSQLVKTFSQGQAVESLCFCLAGPIRENRFELTNTGQVLYLQQIRERFPEIPRIAFLNDLESLAYSLPRLKETDRSLFWGNSQPETQGAKAIVSLGTGLGISAVSKEGTVLASEGGHVDFAPRDEQQLRLLKYLEEKYGHVSYERILAGQGISNLYGFLEADCGKAASRESQPHGEQAAVEPAKVTEKAFAGEETALETFRLFTRILGAACGNAALTYMAQGGVYLAGGIVPKILPLLDADIFGEAFLDKGRFRGWLETVPVYGILEETAPSIGAAAYCYLPD